MATVDEGIQSQIRNIEKQYGKPLADWIKIVNESGKTKHTEIVAMLKTEHGMAHGAAHRVALQAKGADSTSIVKAAKETGADPVLALYEGPKAAVKPIHDKLMDVVRGFGSDIELAPKSGYVSLRRKKQFAMIQPAAKRIDLGLILKDTPVTDRLESAKSFNALFTHRVRVGSVEEVDHELLAYLREAYDKAG